MNVIYVYTDDAENRKSVTTYYMTFTSHPTSIIIRPEKSELDTDAHVYAFFKHSYACLDDAKSDALQKRYFHLPEGFRYGTYISYKNEIRHCLEFWRYPSIILEEDQKPFVYQLKYNEIFTLSCRDSNNNALPSI